MLSKQWGRTRGRTCDHISGSFADCGTALVRAAFGWHIAERVMKARYFHHQPRSRVTATGPIAHADEDDDQIETWMIGQGQEPSGNRHIGVRRAWERC